MKYVNVASATGRSSGRIVTAVSNTCTVYVRDTLCEPCCLQTDLHSDTCVESCCSCIRDVKIAEFVGKTSVFVSFGITLSYRMPTGRIGTKTLCGNVAFLDVPEGLDVSDLKAYASQPFPIRCRCNRLAFGVKVCIKMP